MVLGDVEVQERLHQMARSGKLPPVVYQTLMYYAWGKPKDTLSVEADIAPMIIDETHGPYPRSD